MSTPELSVPDLLVDAARLDTYGHVRWSGGHEAVARWAGADTVRRDLADLERAIAGTIGTDLPVILDGLGEVLRGGKRLRPLLTFTAARAQRSGMDAAPARDRMLTLGCAVELLHVGSLIHDDVMDEATTRHGVRSVNAARGMGTAVLCGDHLIAAAFARAAGAGPDEVQTLVSAFTELCAGQAREMRDLHRLERTESDYFACIAGKTAALFSAACRLGVLATGGDGAVAAALARFGHHLGIAFQIVDDLLDLTQTQAALGKPAGQDLAAGVYTLPVLRALPGCPEIADAVRAGDLAAARELVLGSAGIESAWDSARLWTRRAGTAIADCAAALTPGAAGALEELAVVLVDRSR